MHVDCHHLILGVVNAVACTAAFASSTSLHVLYKGAVFEALSLCAEGQQPAEGLEGRAKSMDTAVARQMLRLKGSPMRVSADNLPLATGSPRLKVSKVHCLPVSVFVQTLVVRIEQHAISTVLV